MTCVVIDGKCIAAEMLSAVRANCTKIFGTYSISPKIATILVGDDEASKIYVNSKIKVANSVGIEAQIFNLNYSCSNEEIKDLILELNKAPDVTGVLVQFPLPSHIDKRIIFESISFFEGC